MEYQNLDKILQDYQLTAGSTNVGKKKLNLRLSVKKLAELQEQFQKALSYGNFKSIKCWLNIFWKLFF